MRYILLFLSVLLLGISVVLAQEPDDVSIIDFTSSTMPRDRVLNYTFTIEGIRVVPIGQGGCKAYLNISISDDFTGINTNGTTTPNAAPWVDADLSSQSFYGNTLDFNGSTNPTACVAFEGDFIEGNPVQVEVFASRIASDNRQTCYTLIGLDSMTACLDVSNNTDEVVSLQVLPNTSPAGIPSKVILEVTAGPDNDNVNGFYYLGGLRFTTESTIVRLPGVIRVTKPSGGEVVAPGDTLYIAVDAGYCNIDLQYQTGPSEYQTIVEDIDIGRLPYAWVVPNVTPLITRVRAITSLGDDRHISQPFLIEASGASAPACNIVVLGSSTAAGTGPTSTDSTWVNRFTRQIRQRNSNNRVINLARGGYTTYQLLPHGTAIDPAISQTIDSARNITAALALNPTLIIINLPSNDAANGYGVAQQIANYDAMLAAATAQGVPVLLSSPQPRNFSAANRSIQTDLLLAMNDKYGDNVLDYWTPFVDTQAGLLGQFDAGDGVHLNNYAHGILARETFRAFGLEYGQCMGVLIGTRDWAAENAVKFSVYPNPVSAAAAIQVKLAQEFSGSMRYNCFDLAGKLIHAYSGQSTVSGAQDVRVALPNLPTGSYVLELLLQDDAGTRSRGSAIFEVVR